MWRWGTPIRNTPGICLLHHVHSGASATVWAGVLERWLSASKRTLRAGSRVAEQLRRLTEQQSCSLPGNDRLRALCVNHHELPCHAIRGGRPRGRHLAPRATHVEAHLVRWPTVQSSTPACPTPKSPSRIGARARTCALRARRRTDTASYCRALGRTPGTRVHPVLGLGPPQQDELCAGSFHAPT